MPATNPAHITADDIPAPRPVDPFDVRPVPVVVRDLPSYADLGERPVVVLTIGERVQHVLDVTRVSWFILRIAFAVAYILNSVKETGPMAILRIVGRITKWGSVFFTGGTIASGILTPETALAIGSGLYVATDVIMWLGDKFDDGKINKSFKLD